MMTPNAARAARAARTAQSFSVFGIEGILRSVKSQLLALEALGDRGREASAESRLLLSQRLADCVLALEIRLASHPHEASHPREADEAV